MPKTIDTQPGATPSQAPRRLRVLIADDERDSVLTLAELLREEGHDTRGVYRGNDVMEALRGFDPDVVLLDIAMPGGPNGWEIAREIRAAYGHKRPLLIAMTGIYNQAADQILGKMSGFNYYLAKPYEPSVLLTLLREA